MGQTGDHLWSSVFPVLSVELENPELAGLFFQVDGIPELNKTP